jgi:thiamine-phosphate pyrophosphorylase
MPPRNKEPSRLYLITPPTLPLGFPAMLAEALTAGDVACVQLRLKGFNDDQMLAAAAELLEVCRTVSVPSVPLVLNDRPDLALAAGADGVHVGQNDMPYAEARQIVGPDAIVGVTCHDSRHLAIEAAEVGADYVAFGAFFPTNTKTSKIRACRSRISGRFVWGVGLWRRPRQGCSSVP